MGVADRMLLKLPRTGKYRSSHGILWEIELAQTIHHQLRGEHSRLRYIIIMVIIGFEGRR